MPSKKKEFMVFSTGNRDWQHALEHGSIDMEVMGLRSKTAAEEYIREAVAEDYEDNGELSLEPDEGYASTRFIVELHKVIRPVPRATGVKVTLREQHLVDDEEEAE